MGEPGRLSGHSRPGTHCQPRRRTLRLAPILLPPDHIRFSLIHVSAKAEMRLEAGRASPYFLDTPMIEKKIISTIVPESERMAVVALWP
jgi:hypothetical protein